MARPVYGRYVPREPKTKLQYWRASDRNKFHWLNRPRRDNYHVPVDEDVVEMGFRHDPRRFESHATSQYREAQERKKKAADAAKAAAAKKKERDTPWMVFQTGVKGPVGHQYEKGAHGHPDSIAARKAAAKAKLAAKAAAAKAIAAAADAIKKRQALVKKKRDAFYASPGQIAARKAFAKRKQFLNREVKQKGRDYVLKLFNDPALRKYYNEWMYVLTMDVDDDDKLTSSLRFYDDWAAREAVNKKRFFYLVVHLDFNRFVWSVSW